MAKEKKQDMRNGMWERGPVEGWKGGREEALQQARVNIDKDAPDVVRPDFRTQAPGQVTAN